MTPDNLEEHEEHKIWLYSNEDEPDMVNVVLPYHKGQKKYWFVKASRDLTDKELLFGHLILNEANWSVPDYIDLAVPLNPHSDRDGNIAEDLFIRFKIRKGMLRNAYIYYDYPYCVDGGGWCRTYILSSFPVETGKSFLMHVEWDISRFERTGDYLKETEYKELREEILEHIDLEKKKKERQEEANEAVSAPDSSSNAQPLKEEEPK